MGQRINTFLDQTFLDVSVPMVLDLIVCSSWYFTSYGRPFVAMNGVEVDDGIFLVLAKLSTFNVRS